MNHEQLEKKVAALMEPGPYQHVWAGGSALEHIWYCINCKQTFNTTEETFGSHCSYGHPDPYYIPIDIDDPEYSRCLGDAIIKLKELWPYWFDKPPDEVQIAISKVFDTDLWRYAQREFMKATASQLWEIVVIAEEMIYE